jgi:hypothetical protein
MRKLLIGLAVLFVPASAEAASPTIIYGVVSGHPSLSAWSWGDGRVAGWSRCEAGGSLCEPLAVTRYPWDGGSERYAGANPGETAPGTVFEAVVERAGETVRLRTPVWNGTMTTTPPALSGSPTVGATVRTVPGVLSGGWDVENTLATGISACVDVARSRCEQVAGPRTGPAEAVIEARWAGWYLFASQLAGSGNNQVTYIPEEPGPYMLGEPVVSQSDPLGPVCCAPARTPSVVPLLPPAATTKPPSASIRARALRHKGRLIVGRVTCATRCRVEVRVSGGDRRGVRHAFSARGTNAVRVPVRRGRLTVRIFVDGKLLASGRSTYRS